MKVREEELEHGVAADASVTCPKQVLTRRREVDALHTRHGRVAGAVDEVAREGHREEALCLQLGDGRPGAASPVGDADGRPSEEGVRSRLVAIQQVEDEAPHLSANASARTCQ